MKYFLLYDLETSTKYFFGQILSAYFCLVDQYFNLIPEYDLDLKIKISSLELPDPDAILVNKIDVLQHQQESIPEHLACFKINQFILRCIDFAGDKKIKLMGYNSSNFDLPFLRTTLIRNGYSPYYFGKILYSDAYHQIKKLFKNTNDFPVSWIKREENEYYPSLSLENVSKNFGILMEEQKHDAKEDVILMLRLLKLLQQKYSLQFWDEQTFEIPSEFLQVLTSPIKIDGQIQWKKNHYFLLDQDKGTVLLVDIALYINGDGKGSIRYFNKNTGFLIGKPDTPEISKLQIIQEIIEEFKTINCSNFFERSTCDIEQDIYRLNFKDLDLLSKKVSGIESDFQTSNPDLQSLWERYKLRSADDNQLEAEYYEMLKSYFNHRYIQSYKISKWISDDQRSPTFYEMLEKLNERLNSEKGQDLRLMERLKEFYEKSYFSKIVTKKD